MHDHLHTHEHATISGHPHADAVSQTQAQTVSSEERLALLCRHAPVLRRNAAATRVVDGRTVGLHEGSNVLQSLDGFVGELSVGARTDVEQEVGIQASRCDKPADEFVAALIGFVGDAVAPGVVHRHARLQGELRHLLLAGEACVVLSWQVLLEELKVLEADGRAVMVVADETLWLQLLDEGILLLQAPVELLL